MPAAAAPWYFGKTVGEKYGQTRRLLLAIAAGREDPRWLGFIEKALGDRAIPAKYRLYIRPFAGTEAQRTILRELLAEIAKK